MLRFFYAVLFLFIAPSVFLFSQEDKVLNVFGEGKKCLTDETMSIETAKEKALFEAKKNAIEKSFGSHLRSETILDKQNKINFATKEMSQQEEMTQSIAEELLGEFIGNPQITYSRKTIDDEWCIVSTIEGKAIKRNIALEKNLSFLPLLQPNKNSVSNTFKNGSNLYLYAKSPIKGYLSVFLIADKIAYKILPYLKLTDVNYIANMPIEADKEYIFFDKRTHFNLYNNISVAYVDNLVLDMDDPKQISTMNKLVFIFSKEPIKKPLLNERKNNGKIIVPASLSEEEFRNWLSYQKMDNPSIVFIEKIIKIIR